MADGPLLLDEKTRGKLNPLMLVASRVRAGVMKGDRRSIKRGTSIEFADYRNYVPGDDLRRLDWNVYARLERPYIKLLEDEEDLAVHLLLDVSESMNWPRDDESDPDQNKLLYARRLMAGLAYISLTSNDRLTLTALSDRGAENFGPARGQAQTVGMLRFMHSVKAGGITDLNAVLRDYAVRYRRPGLTIIISDMFSPGGYLDGLNALLSKGHEVALIHILSPDEVTPPLTGDLRLVDVETGQAQEISLDSAMRDFYIRRVEAWRSDIRAECVRRGVHYVAVITDEPWEKVILQDLRRLQVVK
jgi:uncharacterized protein (DUF58 family)